jgi:hypothetical protein
LALPAPRDLSPFCGAAPCPCKKGTTVKPTHPEQRCQLEAPLVVQGIPCAPGDLDFYRDGALKYCEQDTKPVVLDSVECGGGWHIWMHQNHRLAQCGNIKPVTLGTFELRGPNIALFSDGKLSSGELAKDIELDGIHCRRSVELYKTGKLQSCQVAAPVTRGTIVLQPNDFVTLREDGTIKRVQLAKDTTIEGKLVKADIVCFDSKGKLTRPTNECSSIASAVDEVAAADRTR